MNHSCTTVGQALMKNWFHRPSTNINVIKSRQDFISVLIDPENEENCKQFRKSLRQVKNVPRILTDIEIGRARLEDWKSLLDFFKSYKLLKENMKTLVGGEKTQLYINFLESISTAALDQNTCNIENIIDFELSDLLKRVVVQRNIDSELDRVRDIYDSIESVLATVASEITKATPGITHPINVMYFPQLGYLIVFDSEYADEFKTLVDQQTWECVFVTDTHSYCKSAEMKEMDKEYGDLYGIICDHEIEIIQSLQEEILKSVSEICQACHLCAQLDCHLSFAEVASRRNYVRPEITTDNILEIEMGMHPIYENVVDSFIGNDVILSEEENEDDKRKILLLTGANYSGKTVYLTQCALLVYMAHLGSFIPAQRAKIGITDRIIARLSNRESVSKVRWHNSRSTCF